MAVVSLVVGACGSGEGSARRGGATASTPAGPTPIVVGPTAPTPAGPTPAVVEPTLDLLREWVAVFRVADIGDDRLDKEIQELLRLVPMNIAVGPVGCWVGLRERLGNPPGETSWVSAVVAGSRTELERVVDKVGRQPLLVGEFPAMCVD